MNFTDTEISELEDIAKSATPGPWRVDGSIIEDMKRVTIAYARHPHTITHWDSEYIARFNPAVTLRLLNQIKDLKEMVNHLEECRRKLANKHSY